MKKLVLPLLCLCLLLSACDPYGKKVSINSKSEVYYKEGVTEAEARRLGDFLLSRKFFDGTHEKSVQLEKEDTAYIVRFVVDKAAFEQDRENALLGFKVWQMWIADSVFNGTPTRVILADNEFTDLQDAGQFTPEEKAAILSEQTGATAPDSSRVDNTRVDASAVPQTDSLTAQ